MKLKFSFLLLFFIISFSLKSQNEFNPNLSKSIESKIRELKEKSDVQNEEIDDVFKLIKKLSQLDIDLVKKYLNKMKPILEKTKYYHGWINYGQVLVLVNTGNKDMRNVEISINEIYDRYKDKLTLEDKTFFEFFKANIANELNQIKRSQIIINKALPIAKGTFLRASLYYINGDNFLKLGDYQNAVRSFFHALKLYDSIKNTIMTASTYDQISNAYSHLGDYKKSIAYSRKAIYLAKKDKNYQNLKRFYTNIGVDFRGLKKLDSAKYYYMKSIEMARKTNDSMSVAQNLMNMGNLFLDQSDFEQSRKYFHASLDLCYASGFDYGKLLNYINLAYDYQMTKEYIKAKSNYDSAIVYAIKLKEPPMELEVYRGYFELFEETADYKNALMYYKKYQEINEQLNREEAKKGISEIQTKYNVAIKDKKLAAINNEIKTTKFKNRILIVLSILGICTSAFIIYFLQYRNKSLQKLYERNIENQKIFVSSNMEKTEQENDETIIDPLKKIFDNLELLMIEEKIYKSPNLSLSDVSEKLNTNQKYISQAISNYSEMNFSNYINHYRIQEAKMMIRKDLTLTLNEVMFLCGFNSRTPFYTAFQKHTGMSPKQFKDLSITRSKKEKSQL